MGEALRAADVFAFDTGPANMAIDYFATLVPGNAEGIDRDGALSSEGQFIPSLLEHLLTAPFFARHPPKAAGYREFGPAVLTQAARQFPNARPQDLVRSGVEFAAKTLGNAYRQFIFPRYSGLDRVNLSGGCKRNRTLVRRIQEELIDVSVEVMSPEEASAKEALAFAILANETLSGRAGNIPGVTGAKRSVVLGEIAF